MNWLPAFVSWPLATAAMVCAAGPLIIHLLNRRRYRTVQWAAMEYLLQAMQRNRRILRIWDLLLLALRTAAVLLLGLGLAQPFFTTDRTAKFDGREPLHAVLLIDNSLSMGCQSLEGTLLDAAKQRGVEFIRQLPAGSRITIAPLCGSAEGLTLDAFQSPEHAEEALERIQIAGRGAAISTALNLARQASEIEPQLAKRLVLLTDDQAVNWQGAPEWDSDKPLQVATVRPAPVDNTWIEAVFVEDNLADIETPATVAAIVRHEGGRPRDDLQVTLTVDGEVAGVQTIDLPAGSATQEVTFQHLFNEVRPEPGLPRATLLEVSIPEDRLAADDRRQHVAHVVASLPVVFVDTFGDQEDLVRGRVGETRHLRNLLAPRASDSSLIKVRHLRPDQLDRDQLADARLVVVAGIREPGPWTDLLLDYVQQGGQLLLAAGGEFQPTLWNDLAWQDGRHLLPLPLKSTLEGALPEDAGEDFRPFFLDFDTLRSHDYFRIVGVSDDELKDLYSEPMFFQAVVLQKPTSTDNPDVSADQDASNGGKGKGETEGKTKGKTNEDSGDEDDLPQTPDDSQPDDSVPSTPRWVAWPPSEEVEQMFGTPRVLARFDRDQLPFLVERQVGEGAVTFVTTGMLAEWSTLPRTNAILLMDRILRAKIESSLPRRNYLAQDRLAIPLPPSAQRLRWELQRPGDETTETLEPGFIGRNLRGLSIDRPLTPGAYFITGHSTNDNEVVQTIPLAIQSPSDESQLEGVEIANVRGVVGDSVYFLQYDEPISLAGAQTKGHNLWWWLVLTAMIFLLVELLILAPRRANSGQGVPPTPASPLGGEA